MTTPDFTPVADPDSVPVRDAATVVLIRDGAEGIEVFTLQRVAQMAFAGGMTVFPGGGVDPRDGDADISWVGPEPGWWAHRFSVDDDIAGPSAERAGGVTRPTATAQSLVCAAVRETFEECGVLLAGGAEGVLTDTGPYAPARAALVDKSQSLAGFLASHDLSLRADLLVPMAHWITPIGERRRYDTRFFLAALPEGQQADDHTTEAVAGQWHPVAALLKQWQDGEVLLLPPTWAQLDDLSRFDTVAQAMTAPRLIRTVMPEIVSDGSAFRIEFDAADRYHRR
ncbi:NUDIX hydrolase [Williamsia sp. CHRR-6]|uniref:NUDIX hydrolase n=1 Tax=Williamsia sp. CHRR-6 TaxID=2835871 RepID=UPI001BDB0DE5|nr:NUDIX hydrolase [Williamsia sp. CHRR-6]MBT0565482.1 NUDIX hydrolase [Williamsia sp. CHRR-6]